MLFALGEKLHSMRMEPYSMPRAGVGGERG